ncbi:MAG: dephospho-CoA kinase [Candidatus Omnitrophica bacterium]|nr:dephospho-CoA kinase [Candidatus Omnitrophota bacterium]
MIVIGVTGSFGTGKSTVARMLGDLGAVVLDADETVHELMRPGTPVWSRIRRTFGQEVLTSSGEINRKRLGKIVFGDPAMLRRLNRIVHPAVRQRFRQRIAAIKRRDPTAVVVLDVPLLIEAGSQYRIDVLVVVSAPLSAVARRLRQRSGLRLKDVRKIRSYQMPLRQKERMADFIVKNDGSLEATRRRVVRMWKKILKEKG